MASSQAAEGIGPLPFKQRTQLFNPPTQGSQRLPAQSHVDSVNKSSPSVVRSHDSTLSGSAGTFGSLQLGGSTRSYIGSGSLQATTPSTLWPQTPSPAAILHPNFGSGSSFTAYQGSSSSSNATSAAQQALQQEVAGRAAVAAKPVVAQVGQPVVPIAAPPGALLPAPAPQVVWVQVHGGQPLQNGDPRQAMPTLLCQAGYSQARKSGKAAAQVPMARESVGSALHGIECQPCAWFWKAGRGCQNAADCSYCHLCPPGELKTRKKAKLAAIRMGVLEPTRQPLAGTLKGRLKLEAVLQRG